MPNCSHVVVRDEAVAVGSDLLAVVQGLVAILAVGRLRPGHLDLACDNVGVRTLMATVT
ncbi:hypothetical protein TIFTF001_009802 [Ficus carica]|uniref:Uncharacterized protein n=1 Tax=Ficus carica TaxID=3494 RepID=A0AA87ZVX7_FICCA|nr:hypothetical protein TIFTF001_009802 [Ficus carica]